MKINSDLNIVLPVRTDEKGNVLVHGYHTPISRAVFEANYRVLAATKSALAGKGIHYQMDAGPRIAGLVLRDESAKESREVGNYDADGKPNMDGALALLADIKRLTMILVPTPEGWAYKPVDVAIANGFIDDEEWGELSSQIVFFTAHYSMAKRADREKMGRATASVLNALSTSSSVTDYAFSLPTLTNAEVSVVQAA